ncbi:hypothetical protein DL770_010959 [Monosporascus sp. CRB-9-2]|nr:hypothetical protein DL770_010959 [Monosporascus sp. CRB-9-2]
MAGISPLVHGSPAEDDRPALEERKLRKGDGGLLGVCKRRTTKCVNQESAEAPESASAGGRSFYWVPLKPLAFMASAALCLAHTDAHQRPLRVKDATDDGGPVFGFLAHQRLSRRCMVRRLPERIDYLIRADTNSTGFKIAAALRHLLVIEAESASGSSYDLYYTPGGEGYEVECAGEPEPDAATAPARGHGYHLSTPLPFPPVPAPAPVPTRYLK